MAFGLSKNSGAGRAPDLVDYIGPGAAFIATPTTITAGKAVTITAGKLVQAVAADDIAGYLVCEYGGTVYATGGTVMFPDGVDADSKVLFQPVTRINPIQAPIEVAEVAAGDILIGELLNIHTTGTGLDGSTSATGTDFKVQKILNRDSDGKATIVEGVFVSPGYFA